MVFVTDAALELCLDLEKVLLKENQKVVMKATYLALPKERVKAPVLAVSMA